MGQECSTDKDYGPKNSLLELMDLSETRAQVDGPPMHLNHLKWKEKILRYAVQNSRSIFYLFEESF